MLRYFFAALLLVAFTATEASAQTKARKKIAPYSSRKTTKKPAVKINPHTGKPYGAGVSQDVKDGSAYLAPGMPMRKRDNYQNNGGYNDNRARAKKTTNSSLNSGASATSGKTNK